MRVSSPVAEQCHQTCSTLAQSGDLGPKTLTSTKDHEEESVEGPAHRPLLHVRREHELVRHKLDQPGVDQNASTDGVKDTVDQERCLALRRVRVADTQPDGYRKGGRQTVSETENVGSPMLRLRPWDCGKTRP